MVEEASFEKSHEAPNLNRCILIILVGESTFCSIGMGRLGSHDQRKEVEMQRAGSNP